MRQIRRGVFETNSSSVHSITMCSEEEFEKFRNGELWHIKDNWYLPDAYKDKEWLTPQEAREALLASQYFDRADGDPFAMDDYEVCKALDWAVEPYDYIGGEWFETYEARYRTPGGETVYAFGYYGHD